jgi:hypothetical protein
MSKLIGTAPNQVPTNSDLGTAAYLDVDRLSEHITEVTIGGVTRELPHAALDVFVYNTADDSDGGKWRYNMADNSISNLEPSDIRSSRKEFPAVAVLVLTSVGLKILDGDDPNLPVWYEFQNTVLPFSGSNQACTALNGKLYMIRSNYVSVMMFDIANDEMIGYHDNDAFFGKWAGELADYNSITQSAVANGWSGSADYSVLRYARDADAKVLPNSTVDSRTGLPNPTLAVAGNAYPNGAVTLIHADGSINTLVANNNYFKQIRKIRWTEDNKILAVYAYADATDDTHVLYYDVFYKNMTYTIHNDAINSGYYTSSGYPGFIINYPNQGSSLGYIQLAAGYDLYAGNVKGLARLAPNNGSAKNSMVTRTASNYATGWMNGRIVTSVMNSTESGTLTGGNLISNGTFDANIDGWTAETDTTITNVSGRLRVTKSASSGPYGIAYIDINTQAGDDYLFVAKSVTGSGPDAFYRFDDGGIAALTETDGQVHVYRFTAAGETTRVALGVASTSSGAYIEWENVSVTKVEDSHCSEGNDFQIYGTLNKNPVATGAERMAYSNWGLSNYLKMPPNDLLTGANQRAFMLWFKTTYTSNYQYLFSVGDTASGYGLAMLTGTAEMYVYDATNGQSNSGSKSYADGQWHMAVLVDNLEEKIIYVDGEEIHRLAVSSHPFDSDHEIYLGLYCGSAGFNYNMSGGSLSSFRYTRTIPSPEQIKRMYEDERLLFKPDAKCALYGYSDDVNAVDYDRRTGYLHAGTVDGRSVFKGLQRIDQKSDGITEAISANNGFVAEE